MHDHLAALARDWLVAADRLGWGVEGPEGHDRVTEVVGQLAAGEWPDADALAALADTADDRDLGARPVDALFEASSLLARAAAVDDARRRDELLSAARGWLQIASP